MEIQEKACGHSVEVTMLGEFTVSIDGQAPIRMKGRTKRVWMLIEYLLANREESVTQEQLVEMMWDNGVCRDPMNALKNLAYRARTILNELSGDPNAHFIVFEDGRYAWNSDYPTTIDCDEMDGFWKLSSKPETPPEERMELYRRMLALYGGDFLPKSSYREWAASRSAYFSIIHNSAVIKLSGLLLESGVYEEVINVCRQALVLNPLEVSTNKMLLYAYASAGLQDRATEHYNHAVELFYRDRGMDVAAELRASYSTLSNSVNNNETDLSVIRADLHEAAAMHGAYFCEYDVFKNLYRVQARSMAREGSPAFIALFSINAPGGGAIEAPVLKITAARLRNALQKSLRRGDVVATYSPAQFIALLPQLTYENTTTVCERVILCFKRDYKETNVRVSVKLDSLNTEKE